MIRTTAFLAFLAVPALAFANPTIMKKYKQAHPDQTVNCKTCHTKGKELNDFGKKYKETTKKEKGGSAKKQSKR